MAVVIVGKDMLYCPKCGSTYQDGTQRFCTNDGGRLLASPSANKSVSNSHGVFTNLLGRSNSGSENDEQLSPTPRFTSASPKQSDKPNFQTSFSSKVFKDESPAVKVEDKSIQAVKPVVRLIKPEEVHSGTADVGDRKSHPTGRLALTKQNPKILYGQTIKGRYYITELLHQDEESIVYLADDKIIADKQVIFRVLMKEKTDEFLSKILAEERVSLSHINHPNIAHLFDSGELLEGNPFIVSEYVDGFSLEEKLQILDNFNSLRTARIIRQASYGLSEAHQNGILHRGLKPSNIFLTISEAGTEQVKVTDFVVSNTLNRRDFRNLSYVSPEQLEGKLPNFASDIYSLAVIAFQMLTGKLPFNFTTADQLLKAEREGLKLGPSNLRPDISPVVDEVLEKALSYSPSDRYPKARDFGDALYNALTAPSKFAKQIEPDTFQLKKDFDAIPEKTAITPPVNEETPAVEDKQRLTFKAKDNSVEALQELEPLASLETKKAKINDELAWEKRSPEPIRVANGSVLLLLGLGLLALGIGIWAIWHYFLTRPAQPEFVPNNPEVISTNEQNAAPTISNTGTNTTNSEEVESIPLPRSVSQPPNTEYFQNSKADLKDDLAKNYRGFSLYYPNTWTKNQSDTNFVDVSKKTDDGLPVEQFLVTHYDSKGTFKLDKDKFPAQVQESVKKLSKEIPNFKLVSEGETLVNGAWKAYEMKFQGSGTAKNGKPLAIWGRRLFIPAARQGVKAGFLITLLTTSLSPDIKSVDDVGIKGELGNILETFEPSTLD